MRKTTLALLTVFALAFVSACGASGGDDATSSTTQASESSTTTGDTTTTTEDAATTTSTTLASGSDAVDVEEWAKGFCGSFGGWLDDVKDAGSTVGDSVKPGDVPGAKAAIVNMFATVSDDTQSLIDSLEDGGFPDIKNGDDFTDELIGKFQEFDDAIVTAKGEAEGLPLDNPAEFKSQVDALVATFTAETEAVGDSFGELDTKYQSAKLNAALTESCKL